jgi:hypothetical protein
MSWKIIHRPPAHARGTGNSGIIPAIAFDPVSSHMHIFTMKVHSRQDLFILKLFISTVLTSVVT